MVHPAPVFICSSATHNVHFTVEILGGLTLAMRKLVFWGGGIFCFVAPVIVPIVFAVSC